MAIEIGNIKDQQNKKRGWLVGQFFPEDSTFKDENVEIYCKLLLKHEFKDKLHVHPKGKEYMIVLEGEVTMQIGDEIVDLKKGNYVAIISGTPDKIIDFEDKTVIIGVRCPSISDNKKLLEK